MLSHHLIVISFNLFHINPSQYADFKSLTGDVSDNIKSADSIDKPSIKDSISNSFIPFLFWQHKNSFSKNLIRNQPPQSYLHSIYMHKHIRPACVTVHPPRIQLLLSMSVMHKKGGVNKKSFYFLYFVSILFSSGWAFFKFSDCKAVFFVNGHTTPLIMIVAKIKASP